MSHLDTQRWANDASKLNELRHHALDCADGDGEADAC